MVDKGRVYIVDDDALIVSVIARVLERAGYDVRSSGDALHIEAAISSFSPDVIILDIGLPGRSGLDALKGVRETDFLTCLLMEGFE